MHTLAVSLVKKENVMMRTNPDIILQRSSSQAATLLKLGLRTSDQCIMLGELIISVSTASSLENLVVSSQAGSKSSSLR